MMKLRHAFVVALLSAYAASPRASADTLFLIDDGTNTLLRMDPTSYAISVVGSTGVATGDFGDLTYDSANNTLYWSAGRDNGNLYTLDQNTGAATLVGATGVNDLFALTYDPANGKFYGMSTDGNTYTIDPTTGAGTLLGGNSLYPGGLTYNTATGQLVALQAGTGSFYSIDPTTGAASFLAALGFVDDNGVAYDPTRNAYWYDQYGPGSVSKIDATSYAGGVVQTYAGFLDGIAYVNAVPEPSTFALLGLGAPLLAVAHRRRKRTAA